jgi:hypothetical protein
MRLHLLFPLVPILELRLLLLSLEHSFLHLGTEELLSRSSPTSKNRLRLNGSTEVIDLAEVGRSVLGALGRLFVPTSRRTDSKSNPTPSATPTLTDPVLTPHDLFHSSSFTSALASHFVILFPTLSPTIIERAVMEEGGSYASLRARLELRAAEAAAKGAGKGGKGKWWSFLASPSSFPSASSSGEGALGDVKREQRAREVLLSSRSRTAKKELEAYEVATRRPTLSRAPSTMAPEADEQPPAEDTGECQCCFLELPFPSPTNPSIACSDDEHHTFCSTCLHALVFTYTTGGTPLPSSALLSLALPCFSASSSSSSPCTGLLTPSTLSRALIPSVRRTLEARSAAANLEALVSSAGEGEGRRAVDVQRCPFCPYAELKDSTRHAAGPLGRTFFPAWTDEAFPPSPWAVLRTFAGVIFFILFNILISLIALICPVPLPRLERLYADLSSSTASNNPPQTHPSSLPLSTILLLSPQNIFPLSAAYLRHLAGRVLRRKDGECTVFRCRNDGTRRSLVSRSGGGAAAAVDRMERVDEEMRKYLKREGEGRGRGEEEEEVEERRREALVSFVWGAEAASADAPESEEVQEKCGKLSCLLCQSALNPTCPSLHRCSTSSAASTTANTTETDQEKAEESLRLAVERAMSAAVGIACGRCGAGVVKEGGCNKVRLFRSFPSPSTFIRVSYLAAFSTQGCLGRSGDSTSG